MRRVEAMRAETPARRSGRDLPRALALLGLLLWGVALGAGRPGGPADRGAMASVPALPALADAAAWAQLRRLGLAEGPRAAMAEARYRPTPAVGAERAYLASNPAQRLAIRFTAQAVEVRPQAGQPAWTWTLRLAGYGYESRLEAPAPAWPEASGERVTYRRGDLAEWYHNGPAGLEQGFTLAAPPAGRGAGGPLRLELALAGDLRPEFDGADLRLVAEDGRPALGYRGLRAWDAAGRALPGWLELAAGAPGERGRLALAVADEGAAYPLTIDPLIVNETRKLTAADGELFDHFGYAVALSGDTALVGAPHDDGTRGSVYVFVRSGAGWVQQAKLPGGDPAGRPSLAYFGWAVALSGDTAVIGAFGEDFTRGAAYVFVRSGTSWSQQARLTAADRANSDAFGAAVALSGNTAVIGAHQANPAGLDDAGAAYVFARAGASWSQQAKLTAGDGAELDAFGAAVAVSGDTALIGAPNDDWDDGLDRGSAYAFVRSGASWSQQAKLLATDGAANDRLGLGVALDGDTALVGASGDAAGTGAAHVFTRGGAGWGRQAKLTPSDGAGGDFFGQAVALSGDTALVGAYGDDFSRGGAYIFVRRGASWGEHVKLMASDTGENNYFGSAAALSGATALVGVSGADPEYFQAAYVFEVNLPPIVSAGGPYSVPEGGGGAVGAAGADPNAGDSLSYAWDLDDNGSFETPGQTVAFSAANLDGPAVRALRVRATDGGGLTTVAAATITILNVAPTATFGAPASVPSGAPIALTLTGPADPGGADRAAGFSYAFDCGDGGGYSAFGAVAARSCPPGAPGGRTVKGKLRDKDGGVGEYSAIVSVTGGAGPVGATTWYFAEGYTGAGFDEYLTIQNAGAAAGTATITYYVEGQAAPVVRAVPLAAASRTTVSVHAPAGAGNPGGLGRLAAGHSTKVEASVPVVVERPMYFVYGGGISGGHVVMGAAGPSTTWHFAEGYTGAGFDEYLTIMNPGGAAGTATITYYVEGQASPTVRAVPLVAGSRTTVSVHLAQSASNPGGLGRLSVGHGARVTTDVPTVVERPMYFAYGDGITGGHDVMGASATSQTWRFAEGYTGPGFDQYLTINNPGAAGSATITYYVEGQAAPVARAVPLAAGSRTTVVVHAPAGAGNPGGLGRLAAGHSATVESTVPVVVERPMYFRYGDRITGGHVVMGATRTAGAWLFAEGYTGPGFDEYLTINNPGAAGSAAITYYVEGQVAPSVRTVSLLANSRTTVSVHSPSGAGNPGGLGRLAAGHATKVEASVPVVVERPMYFRYGDGVDGGHDVLGFAP